MIRLLRTSCIAPLIAAGALALAGCASTNTTQITDALLSKDPRAALGRIGERKVEGYKRNPQQLVADFEALKQQLERLFGNLRQASEKKWGKEEAETLPGPRRYVKYTDGYKNRIIVDYERGTIRIEHIEDPQAAERIRGAIVVALLTPEDPRSTDVFSDADVILDGKPFLQDMVLDQDGKAMATREDVERFAAYLVSNRLQNRRIRVDGAPVNVAYVHIEMIGADREPAMPSQPPTTVATAPQPTPKAPRERSAQRRKPSQQVPDRQPPVQAAEPPPQAAEPPPPVAVQQPKPEPQPPVAMQQPKPHPQPARPEAREPKLVERLVPPNHYGPSDRLAPKFKPLVEKYAQRTGMDAALIMGIIYQESRFNPHAVSKAGAFGMMQLVPSSGGLDAFRKAKGESTQPTKDYLMDPENNIELGSIYLGMLVSDYWCKSVAEASAREYCAIAAYNTGPGNVARAFVGNTKDLAGAQRRANSMPSEQMFEHLRMHLPHAETRDYLPRVTAARWYYRQKFYSEEAAQGIGALRQVSAN